MHWPVWTSREQTSVCGKDRKLSYQSSGKMDNHSPSFDWSPVDPPLRLTFAPRSGPKPNLYLEHTQIFVFLAKREREKKERQKEGGNVAPI